MNNKLDDDKNKILKSTFSLLLINLYCCQKDVGSQATTTTRPVYSSVESTIEVLSVELLVARMNVAGQGKLQVREETQHS